MKTREHKKLNHKKLIYKATTKISNNNKFIFTSKRRGQILINIDYMDIQFNNKSVNFPLTLIVASSDEVNITLYTGWKRTFVTGLR